MSYEMDRLIYGNEREAEGRQTQLFDLVIKDLLSLTVAANEAGMEVEEFEKALEKYKTENATE